MGGGSQAARINGMKIIFLAGAAVLIGFVAGAQQLVMYHSFGGAHYEYHKDTSVFHVSPKQVGQILIDDPLAYAEFKRARTNNTIGGIMGFLGAGLAIIPIATAITGGEPEWSFAAGGGALILGALHFGSSYKLRAQYAVDLYNSKHSTRRTHAGFFLCGTTIRFIIRL